MKDLYIKPQADVETFTAVDVITTSGGDSGTRDPIELPDL